MKIEDLKPGALYRVTESCAYFYRKGDLCRHTLGNLFDFRGCGNTGSRGGEEYAEEGVYGEGRWVVSPDFVVPAEETPPEKCEWRFNRYSENGMHEWAAGCGIETDLPPGSQPCKHMHWTYCPFCGREIVDLTVDC